MWALPGASILLRLGQFFPEMGSKVLKVLKVWGLSPLFYQGAQGAQIFIYLFSRPLLFIGGKTLWVDGIPGYKFAQI